MLLEELCKLYNILDSNVELITSTPIVYDFEDKLYYYHLYVCLTFSNTHPKLFLNVGKISLVSRVFCIQMETITYLNEYINIIVTFLSRYQTVRQYHLNIKDLNDIQESEINEFNDIFVHFFKSSEIQDLISSELQNLQLMYI